MFLFHILIYVLVCLIDLFGRSTAALLNFVRLCSV